MPNSASRSLAVHALLYTRFQDVEGYVIAAADPADAIGDQQFKDIGAHFLPGKDLCHRVISLTVGPHRVMGFPVRIEAPRYSRSAFVFCICFVVDSSVAQASLPTYRRLAELLAGSFAALERDPDLRLLSDHRGRMQSILFEVRAQLNDGRSNHVFVRLSGSQAIHFSKRQLTPIPYPMDKPNEFILSGIRLYDIPVPLIDTVALCAECPEVDLGLAAVLKAVNGQLSVADLCSKIPFLSPSAISDSLHLLASAGTLLLTSPIDEFSKFRLTENTRNFFSRHSDRAAAAEFAGPGVNAEDVVRVLAKITSPEIWNLQLISNSFFPPSFSSTSIAAPEQVYRLVLFALFKDVIRQLRLFPFASQEAVAAAEAELDYRREIGEDQITEMAPVVGALRACDGQTGVDEILYSRGISRRTFFNFIRDNAGIVTEVWA